MVPVADVVGDSEGGRTYRVDGLRDRGAIIARASADMPLGSG